MDWNYLFFTLLGFFIGIAVCFLYVAYQLKRVYNLEKSLEIDITVGDTVWYRGEKWQVSLHDYWSDGNATVTHKFYLRNDLRGVANAELFEIKKVIRANSYTDHVN